MKRNYLPGPKIVVEGIVPLSQGGTNADNPPDARENLGLTARDRIGLPLGPIPLDETGKIPERYLDGVIISRVELDGPEKLDVGEEGEYQITNFDSRILYLVTATNGSVRIDHDKVYYTAPPSSAVQAGFFVNGGWNPIQMDIIDQSPERPNILMPSTDTVQNSSTVTYVSSAFSTTHQGDTLAEVIWEFALDSLFVQPLPNTITVGKTGLNATLSNIPNGTTIYGRVAHKGQLGFTSIWSATRSFTRPSIQLPQTPTIVQPTSGAVLHDLTQIIEATSFVGTAPGDAFQSAQWQVAKTNGFTQDLPINILSPNQIGFTGEYNQNYYVRVRYTGTSGWTSNWSPVRMFVITELNQTPVVQLPTQDSYLSDNPIHFTSSSYVSSSPTDTFQEARWEISGDPNFGSLLSGETKTGSSAYVFDFATNENTPEVLYCRTRHKGSETGYTDWSESRSVYFYGLRTPTILFPTQDVQLPTDTFTGMTNAFKANVPTITHQSSDWELYLGSLATLVASDLNSSNKTAWTPAYNLVEDGDYILRVRHRSSMVEELGAPLVSPWVTVNFKGPEPTVGPEPDEFAPKIVTPAVNLSSANNFHSLISTPFEPMDSGSLSSSTWEVSNNPNFTSIVHTEQIQANEDYAKLEFEIPNRNADYYYRVSYTDSNSNQTDWSNTRKIASVDAVAGMLKAKLAPHLSFGSSNASNGTTYNTVFVSNYDYATNQEHLALVGDTEIQYCFVEDDTDPNFSNPNYRELVRSLSQNLSGQNISYGQPTYLRSSWRDSAHANHEWSETVYLPSEVETTKIVPVLNWRGEQGALYNYDYNATISPNGKWFSRGSSLLEKVGTSFVSRNLPAITNPPTLFIPTLFTREFSFFSDDSTQLIHIKSFQRVMEDFYQTPTEEEAKTQKYSINFCMIINVFDLTSSTLDLVSSHTLENVRIGATPYNPEELRYFYLHAAMRRVKNGPIQIVLSESLNHFDHFGKRYYAELDLDATDSSYGRSSDLYYEIDSRGETLPTVPSSTIPQLVIKHSEFPGPTNHYLPGGYLGLNNYKGRCLALYDIDQENEELPVPFFSVVFDGQFTSLTPWVSENSPLYISIYPSVWVSSDKKEVIFFTNHGLLYYQLNTVAV